MGPCPLYFGGNDQQFLKCHGDSRESFRTLKTNLPTPPPHFSDRSIGDFSGRVICFHLLNIFPLLVLRRSTTAGNMSFLFQGTSQQHSHPISPIDPFEVWWPPSSQSGRTATPGTSLPRWTSASPWWWCDAAPATRPFFCFSFSSEAPRREKAKRVSFFLLAGGGLKGNQRVNDKGPLCHGDTHKKMLLPTMAPGFRRKATAAQAEKFMDIGVGCFEGAEFSCSQVDTPRPKSSIADGSKV